MGIRLSYERYEEIKRIIVNMFVKYNISCVPVSGFELAIKMGVKVMSYSSFSESKRVLLFKESEDGFCIEKNIGEWYIYYNDNQNYGRINNTIMHEIGHIILDHSEDSELAEKEVKFFAKFALAPPVLIYKYNLKCVGEIARTFEISEEAAYYAYSYYEKRMIYGSPYFTDYETAILQLFVN